MQEIRITADGSHTLYIPDMDESYHSHHGAINESLHVFIKNGLLSSLANPLSILEIGFGTGLNAWLSLLEAEKYAIPIKYVSYELYPLGDLPKALNYPSLHDPEKVNEFNQLHEAPWDEMVSITPFFSIHKIQNDILTHTIDGKFDLIYFDAFAPSKQAEMWTIEVFEKMYSAMNPGGLLLTYCAKGEVRRNLAHAGFIPEKLAGPPGGKREMLRGRKE